MSISSSVSTSSGKSSSNSSRKAEWFLERKEDERENQQIGKMCIVKMCTAGAAYEHCAQMQ